MDALAKIKSEMLPFAELMGIEFTHAASDRVVAELPVREALCTRPAVLHGGAIMAFADTLGATGTILNLPDGAGTTTIESKTNFIAAAPLGTRVIGETANHSETTFPLSRRARCGCPIDSGLPSYVGLGTIGGKAGKIL